jgi:hypothetical protein
MNRHDLLCDAANSCIKELYELAQPHIDWEEFKKENKNYSDRYKVWERFNHLSHKKELTEKELKEYSTYPGNWKDKSIYECIGPRPFEFYYLPKDIFKDIVDSYIHSYKMDDQQNLLDTIEIIKNYCKEPIVDKWIKGENGFPGHRGYDHPDNLEKELEKILHNTSAARLIQEKFFEFLDMAGEFYDWNSELNSFSVSVYLGPTPNSNKEAVIKNWKEYRKQDIEIDEEQIKKDYYGEELD